MTTPAGTCDDRDGMTTRPLAFSRRADRRVLAGVAGGFADAHGVDALVVRAVLVLLTLAGGLGVVIYVLGFAWSAEGPNAKATTAVDVRRTVAFVCVATGASLFVRASGLWLGDTFMLALAVVAAGVVLVSTRSVPLDATRLWSTSRDTALFGRYARWRLLAGAVLVALGLLILGARRGVSGDVRFGAIATALTVVGVALVFGPWLARSAQEVAEERRQRIRSEERAAMAAHLHDSVLQTLALIQRNASDPRRTVTLARRQERELRDWLYGTGEGAETLAAAVRAMAEDVEALHAVRVDAVVVGDRAMDDAAATVLGAVREASVNAAKHAGVHEVSVFVEVRSSHIEAFVRDRGQGFDPGSVASDRKGISESIETRVERAGGTALIDTAPGHGTEVHIHLPLTPADDEVAT